MITAKSSRNTHIKPVMVTDGTKEHFFGYYDKCSWNESGRYILSHQITFGDRHPIGQDSATIGVIDLEAKNQFIPVTATLAWNWQQGSMLQWWPGDPERKIIYNDRRENRFVSVIRDIYSGSEKVLPLPVAAVSHDGSKALSLNFSRLADQRPGYGYAGRADPFKNVLYSENDGIYLLDLNTGKYEFIISVGQIVNSKAENTDKWFDRKHWFNHLMFSPQDKRFIFFHRWRCLKGELDYAHFTEVYTADIDGSNIYCINDHDMTSHYDWRDENCVLAYARRFNIGDKYFLFTDRSPGEVEILGDSQLSCLKDGHCSYSPDRQWVLTDTYPNENGDRLLLLYNPGKDLLIELGRFYSQPWQNEIRCDLHPRWSRDGRQICFDSSHSGSRQVYIMDIAKFVDL